MLVSEESKAQYSRVVEWQAWIESGWHSGGEVRRRKGEGRECDRREESRKKINLQDFFYIYYLNLKGQCLSDPAGQSLPGKLKIMPRQMGKGLFQITLSLEQGNIIWLAPATSLRWRFPGSPERDRCTPWPCEFEVRVVFFGIETVAVMWSFQRKHSARCTVSLQIKVDSRYFCSWTVSLVTV